MIEKSLRMKPAIQGGGPNYLGKQKMVTAPKKWLSSPDHEPAELAYITEKEKDILIDLDLYGSLNGKPNRGPAGIMSLQGDMGSIGGGRSSGGGGGGDGGYQDRIQRQAAANRAAASRAAAAAAAETDRQNRNAAAEAAAKARAEAAKAPISGGESMARFGTPVYAGTTTKVADDMISQGEGQMDAKEKFISQQYIKPPDIYGDADLEGQKEIDDIRAQRQLQSNPNLSRDKRNALEVGLGLRDPKQSGIGTTLKNIALGVLAPQLLAGTALAKPYNLYRQYQTAKRFIPKGIQGTIRTALTRTPTTGTRKTTPLVASDRDGQRVKTVAERVATGQGLESGAKLLGVQDTQKAELFKRRSVVEDILRKGSYQGRDLTSGQRNNLMNYIEQINKFLVPVQQGI